MKIGVYFCNCGAGDAGGVAGKIHAETVLTRLRAVPGFAYLERINFACSEEGQSFIENDIREKRPDRVVIAACSPREHEETFRRVLQRAGMNPYLMQMVNVREQIAWVTEDPARATEKAAAHLAAAVARVRLHEPLQKTELDVCPDVLVIGGGPAGLKTALSLANAGRKVTLVEKGPILGGAPVRREDVFPRMECGPCMLEPILGEVLHSDVSKNIEVRLLSEVVEVTGFFGNFNAKIRRSPRYVTSACLGCGECIAPCPISVPNPVNLGMSERKAIDFEFFGGLPNVPFIDAKACARIAKGEECTKCREACPVEGAIAFDDREEVSEVQVGAIVIAVGAEVYDLGRLGNLGYGTLPDVYSSVEFERILAGNGPTGGALLTRAGKAPKSVAIVHCAGSMDPRHVAYCSAYCCLDAFKFDHLVSHKAAGTRIVNYYRTIVVPGKEEYAAYEHARRDPEVQFVPYDDIADLEVRAAQGGGLEIEARHAGSRPLVIGFDMVVLMAPVVPSQSARTLGEMMEVSFDPSGFFGELHGCTDASRSKVRGIYLAGTCQAPMDIQRAMSQGMATTGYVLSDLVEGRKLEIEPVTAAVDEQRCSGCRTCVPVCPYKAITLDSEGDVARINPVLCMGCGTCVAACPSGSIKGNHFTTEEIFAEVEAVLR